MAKPAAVLTSSETGPGKSSWVLITLLLRRGWVLGEVLEHTLLNPGYEGFKSQSTVSNLDAEIEVHDKEFVRVCEEEEALRAKKEI